MQVAGCVHVSTITPMVRATRPGVVARRAILRELRRRAGADLDAPTYAELSAVTGLGPSSIALHLRTLAKAGLIERVNGALTLTEAGRIATD